MKSVLSFSLTLLCLAVCAQGEEPVYFASGNLKAAVEGELGVSDPTPTEMLELIALDANSRTIDDLTGLGYAVNLYSLNLMHIHNSDFSIVSGLTDLEILNLRWNEISDISFVSGLENLSTLDLGHNDISNISAVSGLSHLSTLELDENRISNLAPLSGLTELYTLDLADNEVSDISPLRLLSSLGSLDLRGNPLGSDALKKDLPVIVANNPGMTLWYDAEEVRQIVISSSRGGSVVEPGDGTFQYQDGTMIKLEASADPCFVFTEWTGTYSTRTNPAYIFVDQDHEICAQFLSTLSTLYVDDNAPNDPGPGDPAISDPDENGTAAHPFDRIQEAIDVAAAETTIRIASGTYQENLDLLGKPITLTGLDRDPANITAYPVLSGLDEGPVLQCVRNEDANCQIMGLVITRQHAQAGPAILIERSSPSLAHCLITGHRLTDTDAAVVTCIDSQALLAHCTIADNQGRPLALEASDVVLTESILWGNDPEQIRISGDSIPSITYCDIAGGWAGIGNFDADPLFAQWGWWALPSDLQTEVGATLTGAVWVPGDYHVRSQTGRWDPLAEAWVRDATHSPAIDAGNPDSPCELEPAPNGRRANIGAYGATHQAAKSRYPW